MSLSPAIRAEVGAGCAVGKSLRAAVNSAVAAASTAPARALTGSVNCKFASSGMHTSENTSPKSPNFSARMVLCYRINAWQERRVLEGCGPSHSMDPLAVWAGDTAVRLLQLMYP